MVKKTGRTSKDFTVEWRDNISKSMKGKSSWNKGVPRTQEERKKMSENKKKKFALNDPTYNIRPACSKEKAAKIRASNLGKRWVHNLESQTRKNINPDQLDDYLARGWICGKGPTSIF